MKGERTDQSRCSKIIDDAWPGILAKAWMDPEYRSRFESDPRAALKEAGIEVSDSFDANATIERLRSDLDPNRSAAPIPLAVAAGVSCYSGGPIAPQSGWSLCAGVPMTAQLCVSGVSAGGEKAGQRGERVTMANEQVEASDGMPKESTAAQSSPETAAVPPRLSLPLSVFRQIGSGLTSDEMALSVDQALILFDELYAHLPLKISMHAVNPVQRLKLLRRRISHISTEADFHDEMIGIFCSVRDLHTNYLLPRPYNTAVVFLPFLVDEYFDHRGIPHYPVVRIMPVAVQKPFEPGIEITHWNGVPMQLAIAANGDRLAGSNMAARHAQGLLAMTSRPLVSDLPPDEDWVTLTYVHQKGVGEIRFPWLVFEPPPRVNSVLSREPGSASLRAMGLDIAQERNHRAREILFLPERVSAEFTIGAGQKGAGAPSAPDTQLTPSSMFPNEIQYGTRRFTYLGRVLGQDFGLLRIRSFNVPDADAFVGEIARILQLLPPDFLLIDVRDNPGGDIIAGERLLQLFTDKKIQPEPMQLRCTPATSLLTQIDYLSLWKPSIDLSVETGEIFSRAFPISSVESCNAIGQRYFGKSALLTSAACYSTTDIFSAGYQDHQIGPVIGYQRLTGAGGANVWTHGLLSILWPQTGSNPFKTLPKGMDMRVAFRRSLRVGQHSGIPLEDLGVRSDHVHLRTRDDVYRDDVDLYAESAALLLGIIPAKPAIQ
jgi:Peptidase family S41